MVKHLLLIPAFFIFLSAGAQVTSYRYQKDIWTGNNTSSICAPAKDSGLYVLNRVGVTISAMIISRLDKNGNNLWSKQLSYAPLYFYSCVCPFDNGVILAGRDGQGSLQAGVITKLDSNGNFVWTKSFYGTPYPSINAVKELADSTLVFSISSSSLYRIIRIDSDGNVIWDKKTDFSPLAIGQKTNSNIVVSGSQLHLKEFDINGNEITEKQYSNPAFYFNGGKLDVSQADDVLMIGQAVDTAFQSSELYLLRIDAAGNIRFSNKYAGLSGSIGYFTRDCGIVVHTNQGILKLDSMGNMQWLKAYDFPSAIAPQYLCIMPDYGYVSIGSGPGFARILKTDLNGETPCNNDTNMTTFITPVPLTLDATLYTDVFSNPGGGNYSLTQSNVVPTFTDHCHDSLSFSPLTPCSPTGLVNITVVDDCANAIFIPNAFSPNNDGQNDELRIRYSGTTCMNNFSIGIYNRWGELVFESKNPDFRWDGVYAGQKLFSQVLNYYIITEDDKGIKRIRKGNISVVL